MKLVDPLKVTCPGCGGESLHSVASLRALEAECPACHRSLREAGQEISDFLREVDNDVIATGIMLVIEKLDRRIKFAEDDSHFTCLSDIVTAAHKAIADLAPTEQSLPADGLVEAAIKEMIPSIDCPPKHLAMVDAFSNEQIERMWAWHFRGWKRVRSDAPEGTGS